VRFAFCCELRSGASCSGSRSRQGNLVFNLLKIESFSTLRTISILACGPIKKEPRKGASKSTSDGFSGSPKALQFSKYAPLISDIGNHYSYYLCIALKIICLSATILGQYPNSETLSPGASYLERLLMMKLAVRVIALSFVLAGAAAVSLSSPTTHAVASHQSATSGLPVPLCGPDAPCPPDGSGGGGPSVR
jgi:hypothetical protein